MPDNTDGTIIGLLPKADDPIVAASSEPAHITMLWFGSVADLSEEDLSALAEAAALWAGKADGIITASVTERGTLGNDEADVVFVDGEGLRAFRDGMAADPTLAEMMGRVGQYETWTPHVTLGYPESPANGEYDGETVEFDRLVLWAGTETTEYALGGGEEEAPVADEEKEPEAVEASGQEWYGVLAPIGVESGDGRMFAEMLSTRELPIPMKYMPTDQMGHDGSVVVANITEVWEESGLIMGRGVFTDTDFAKEAIKLRKENMVRGVSVDLDAVEMEFRTRDGAVLDIDSQWPDDPNDVVMVVTKGRISAATICAIPAFAEAYFNLGSYEAAVPDETVPAEDEDAVVASLAFKSYDAEQRREMAKKGEALPDGSFPIADEEDLKNAIQAIGRAKDPDKAKAHIKKRAKALGKEDLIPEDWTQEEPVTASAAPAFTLVDPVEAVTAAGHKLSASWFKDPELAGPTPMTITEEGMVYGHAATWNECHIGIQDKCVTAPHSLSDYAYFHVGAVSTDEGDVAVGHITMGTGHAALNLGGTAAAAHYDNTGAVVADIHMGEDEHGIWFSGALRADVTEDQVRALKAAAISGDWRPIGAGLEMVAALAVNVPGFPVPRTALAASGMQTTALVAAAVVERDEEQFAELEALDMGAFAREVVLEVRRQDKRDARMAAVAASLAQENRNRKEAILARIGD